MSEGRGSRDRREATEPDAASPGAGVLTDGGTGSATLDVGRGRRLLEYVTFGYGVHHLLKVVLFQFAVLFLDVGLLEYTTPPGGSGRPTAVTATWLFASLVFLGLLTALIRQIGRRTLTPRYHRLPHVAGSVVGYLVASGFSFLFGYATFVLPGRGEGRLLLPGLLPAWLLVVVFATFIAIGYHAQVAVTDHPEAIEILDVIAAWLDSHSWVDEPPDSLGRQEAYAEFVERTADLQTLLSHARTVEGRKLEADFRDWWERFEDRSMLSRELVVYGRTGEDVPESERLADEHEDFVDLRRRLVAIADAGRSE